VASGDTGATASPGPSAQAAGSVTLRVVGTPDAEVRVDDQLVGRTPLVATLPRAAGERVVTVRRLGFLGKTERIAGDADSTVRANLPLKRKRTTTASATPARPFDPDVVSDPFTR